MKQIKNTITINAPKEKVWQVLTLDKYTSVWYNEFSEGTRAYTDWSVGSKVIFKDPGNDGLIATVTASKPAELLAMEYTGMLMKGREDYDSPMAQSVKGGREVYELSEQNGITTLKTSADMDEQMYEMMSAAWEKALQKIIDLSENK